MTVWRTAKRLSINCRYFKGNSHIIRLDVDVHDSFFYIRRCCKFVRTNERTAWEQGLFAALANAEQCTNVPHQMFASFSQATFAFRCKPSFTASADSDNDKCQTNVVNPPYHWDSSRANSRDT